METQPGIPQNTSNEMDPRRKDAHGMDAWMASLLSNNLITQKEYDDMVEKNNNKEEEMEKRNLPQLRHYGFFNSADEIKERIHPKETDRFIIRCKSKEGDQIQRLLDASLDEVVEFAKTLPGGFENWNVEVKEYVKTIAAGTIIVAPNGRTSIETWHGGHYLNVTNCPKYHANFDPDQFDMHYRWDAPEGAEDLSEMQNYAIKALRYLSKHLRPKENEPIYIEYGVRDGGEVYFIEANDSPFLTGK